MEKVNGKKKKSPADLFFIPGDMAGGNWRVEH
jgi:hypothetical protein